MLTAEVQEKEEEETVAATEVVMEAAATAGAAMEAAAAAAPEGAAMAVAAAAAPESTHQTTDTSCARRAVWTHTSRTHSTNHQQVRRQSTSVSQSCRLLLLSACIHLQYDPCRH